MSTKIAMVLALALGTATATAAVAQSSGGSPAAVNDQNKQVGPETGTPTDPAAADNPAARVPTDQGAIESGSSASDGVSSGDTGVDSPAGIPADPNTDQNVQPGPGVGNPTDPAAGDKPGARVPTAP